MQARFSINCSSVHEIVTSRSLLISTWYRHSSDEWEYQLWWRCKQVKLLGVPSQGKDTRQDSSTCILLCLQAPAFLHFQLFLIVWICYKTHCASFLKLIAKSCINLMSFKEPSKLATKDRCLPDWPLRGGGCWSLSYQLVPKKTFALNWTEIYTEWW